MVFVPYFWDTSETLYQKKFCELYVRTRVNRSLSKYGKKKSPEDIWLYHVICHMTYCQTESDKQTQSITNLIVHKKCQFFHHKIAKYFPVGCQNVLPPPLIFVFVLKPRANTTRQRKTTRFRNDSSFYLFQVIRVFSQFVDYYASLSLSERKICWVVSFILNSE